jgi:hypothetical protein
MDDVIDHQIKSLALLSVVFLKYIDEKDKKKYIGVIRLIANGVDDTTKLQGLKFLHKTIKKNEEKYTFLDSAKNKDYKIFKSKLFELMKYIGLLLKYHEEREPISFPRSRLITLVDIANKFPSEKTSMKEYVVVCNSIQYLLRKINTENSSYTFPALRLNIELIIIMNEHLNKDKSKEDVSELAHQTIDILDICETEIAPPDDDSEIIYLTLYDEGYYNSFKNNIEDMSAHITKIYNIMNNTLENEDKNELAHIIKEYDYILSSILIDKSISKNQISKLYQHIDFLRKSTFVNILEMSDALNGTHELLDALKERKNTRKISAEKKQKKDKKERSVRLKEVKKVDVTSTNTIVFATLGVVGLIGYSISKNEFLSTVIANIIN